MKVSSTLKEVNALEEDYKTKSREIFVQNCPKNTHIKDCKILETQGQSLKFFILGVNLLL